MRKASLLWPPHPYRAGFCITDDCDATDLDPFRRVYDFLQRAGLPVTRAVWAFKPDQPCGIPAAPPSILRGITLADPGYSAYCRELAAAGFEICLHGASAGNNRRERTLAALDLVAESFGPPRTHICHAKNADNPYWEHKVAPDPLTRGLLRLYSRHRCSGEVESSPYFWGDACRARIRQVRLFRTRNTDTLAANPSMPYFELNKPLVPGWFSATKRSFRDCTSAPALGRLKRNRGLTVLYQYLHRYAAPAGVTPAFREGIERLRAERDIWPATTGAVMDRLRVIQGLFWLVRGRDCFALNAGPEPAAGVQLELPPGACCTAPESLRGAGGIVVLPGIPAGASLALGFSRPVRIAGPRAFVVPASGRVDVSIGHGRLRAFFPVRERPASRPAGWDAPGGPLAPGAFRLEFPAALADLRPLSRAPRAELLRLLHGQFSIIRRELVSKGRSIRTERFLGRERIRLEDQGCW
jgi:hypothetical protein